jgi:hypothetical protein
MLSFSHTILIGVTLPLSGGVLAAEVSTIDLTHWTAPAICSGDKFNSTLLATNCRSPGSFANLQRFGRRPRAPAGG